MRTETVLGEEQREEWPGWQPECRAGVAGGRAEGHRRTRECPLASLHFVLRWEGDSFNFYLQDSSGQRYVTHACAFPVF